MTKYHVRTMEFRFDNYDNYYDPCYSNDLALYLDFSRGSSGYLYFANNFFKGLETGFYLHKPSFVSTLLNISETPKDLCYSKVGLLNQNNLWSGVGAGLGGTDYDFLLNYYSWHNQGWDVLNTSNFKNQYCSKIESLKSYNGYNGDSWGVDSGSINVIFFIMYGYSGTYYSGIPSYAFVFYPGNSVQAQEVITI